MYLQWSYVTVLRFISLKEWAARRMMDLSRASNCPSVAYQLVGFKKFQQILASPGILEKYIPIDQANKFK